MPTSDRQPDPAAELAQLRARLEQAEQRATLAEGRLDALVAGLEEVVGAMARQLSAAKVAAGPAQEPKPERDRAEALERELAEARESAANWRERYEQINAYANGCETTIGALLDKVNSKADVPPVDRPALGPAWKQPAAWGRQ